MKQLLRSAIILALVIGIASSGFAAGGPTAPVDPFFTSEKRISAKKPRRRARRRAASTIPYTGRNSVIRVRRLSARERRDVFRRLIDIRIN
ncbi:MAG: hypothetical protein ABIU09_06200 [Pyrinomonadaceae bacterium]